jgi:hypothetical protein
MQDYSIERVGMSDLVFTGDLIGQGNGDKPRVKIYRTKTGKFIGELREDAQRSDANHFDKPADLVNWLRGRLAGIPLDVQVAIESAAKLDDSFKNYWTERVE